MEEKVCTVCGEMKPIDDFYPRGDRPGKRKSECRSCNGIRCRENYRKNVDARREYNHLRYTRDAEKVKEQVKKYYYDNRESIIGRVQAYRRDNPDKVREVCRRWQANNPSRAHELRQQRRDTLAAAGTFTAQEWNDLKAHYGNRCLRCGVHESYRKLSVDHVTPLSRGGSNTIDNLQPLCRPCNGWKHIRDTDFRVTMS